MGGWGVAARRRVDCLALFSLGSGTPPPRALELGLGKMEKDRICATLPNRAARTNFIAFDGFENPGVYGAPGISTTSNSLPTGRADVVRIMRIVHDAER